MTAHPHRSRRVTLALTVPQAEWLQVQVQAIISLRPDRNQHAEAILRALAAATPGSEPMTRPASTRIRVKALYREDGERKIGVIYLTADGATVEAAMRRTLAHAIRFSGDPEPEPLGFEATDVGP